MRLTVNVSQETKDTLLKARPGYGTIQLAGRVLFDALALRLNNGMIFDAALAEIASIPAKKEIENGP